MKIRLFNTLFIIFSLCISNFSYSETVEEKALLNIIMHPRAKEPNFKRAQKIMENFIDHKNTALAPLFIEITENTESESIKRDYTNNISPALYAIEQSAKNSIYIMNSQHAFKYKDNHLVYASIMNFYTFLNITTEQILEFVKKPHHRDELKEKGYSDKLITQYRQLNRSKQDLDKISIHFTKYIFQPEYQSWWKEYRQ